MNLQNSQLAVDTWIKEHGVRYFNELTNMAQLTEEVGEVARIIARRYGEQSEKESEEQRPWRRVGRRGFRGFVFGQPNRNRFASRFRQENGFEIGAR
jgi:hypothetical protein